jgi:hypothetical protein
MLPVGFCAIGVLPMVPGREAHATLNQPFMDLLRAGYGCFSLCVPCHPGPRVTRSYHQGNRPGGVPDACHWKSKSDCVRICVTWSGYAANVWIHNSVRRASKSM